MRSKKGISPIIAAIILIAIVVAIGALVANFIRNYVNTQQKSIDISQQGVRCATDVSIKLIEDAAGKKARCTSPETLSIDVQNAGYALQNIVLTAIGSGP